MQPTMSTDPNIETPSASNSSPSECNAAENILSQNTQSQNDIQTPASAAETLSGAKESAGLSTSATNKTKFSGISQTTVGSTLNANTCNTKRKRKCPQKDTILISIPLHVTADLGVAIRRTRRKREGRIKRWLAEETGDQSEHKKQPLSAESAKQKEGKDEDRDDSDDDVERDLESDEDAVMIKKSQYGSVLDYLEAKYVRGISIADYNSQGERVKKKAKQQAAREGSDEEEGEENYDSDQDNNRSVYGDDGFIDDSLLQEEVADQVFASDSYGKTKIEMEAKRKRKEKTECSRKEVEEDDLSAASSDFDDGFFVNIGDLEMEEGWKGDEDVVISPVKRKPGRPKKSEGDQANVKPKTKKRKVDKESTSPKKKKKKVEKTAKDKVTKGASKKKDTDGKIQPVKKKKVVPVQGNGQKKKTLPMGTPKKSPKPKDEPQTPKSIMDSLAKQVKRKLNICIKMINELTPKQLPRKQKQKNTVKTKIEIPADKNIGDTIMFDNPHIPGQKLKVQVPEKANMETRTFFATVPIPKQPPPVPKENDLPKEFKDALYNYSQIFDDWANAKAVHIASLPEKEREDFKPHSEKLKKFDDLVNEFPKNLATPIDVSHLRLVVRRIRNNKSKAKAKAGEASASPTKSATKTTPVAVKEEKKDIVEKKVMASIKLDAPQKGTEFASIVFDRSHFMS